MRFIETTLPGVYVINLERIEDERGFFARSWCEREFNAQGLVSQLRQCNISYNVACGTLRGMHYQAAPYEETKLVRCTRGAVYDVTVDLRPASPTFKCWTAVELTADNRSAQYVPPGCAHGFQTLVDNTEVFYQISQLYAAESARGVRWNDPAFGITWPMPDPPIISERDATFADFRC